MIFPDPKSIRPKSNPSQSNKQLLASNMLWFEVSETDMFVKKNDYHKYSLAQVLTMQISYVLL